MDKSLFVIGLTGGIASGKSTVAAFLREWGVPVIDADQMGHLVLEPDGEAYQSVVEAFGSKILTADKRIDRTALGDLVFKDPERRKSLEQITHPAIARLVKKGLALVAQKGETIAFYEAALLVETGVYRGLDALVVTSCAVKTQLERVVARDGMGREAAAARIASQHPLTEKTALADFVIDTDCALDVTRAATRDVLDRLRERFG